MATSNDHHGMSNNWSIECLFNSLFNLGPGLLRVSYVKFQNSMLVNRDFQTWHLIGWQHSRQPIRSHVRKSLLTNMEFKHGFYLSNPGPWSQRNIKGLHYCPFVRGIHQSLVDSPHKGTVTRQVFPFDDVIMILTVAADTIVYNNVTVRRTKPGASITK